MTFTEQVQGEIIKWLTRSLLGLALLALVGAWLLPDNYLPTVAIEWLGKYSTAQMLLRAIVSIGVLLACIAYLRPCLTFNGRLGIFRDLKSGLYYCPKCKVDKKFSPMKTSESGWHCAYCGHSYSDPEWQREELERLKNEYEKDEKKIRRERI